MAGGFNSHPVQCLLAERPRLSGSFLASFNHNVSETTASYTFASLGAGGPFNYVFVAIFYGTSGIRVPSAVTIDGQTATRVLRANGVTSRGVDIWWALVTTPTTGVVSISFGGNTNNSAIIGWNVVGQIDTANMVAETGSGATSFTGGPTTKIGGFGMVVGTSSNPGGLTAGTPAAFDASGANSQATTFTWAGASAAMNALTWAPNITGGSATLSNYGDLTMFSK